MKETEYHGVLVAEGHNSLCLAVLLTLSKSQIQNALFDLKNDIAVHLNHLARYFRIDDMVLNAYTIFEYENKFTPFARVMAEEVDLDEFTEIVARVYDYCKH